MTLDEQSPRNLTRASRAILVVDVVESVRLMEDDEDYILARWLNLLDHIQRSIIPGHGGRLVKRLGDGLIAEFESVACALDTAFAIQCACVADNAGLTSDRQILLRIGIEHASIVVDANDIYGRGVNLAARLASLANPSEIVVSANVREQLPARLDADIEDLGECFLKHIKSPVRAYRVRGPGSYVTIKPLLDVDDIFPLVAVIPFADRAAAEKDVVLGDVITEELIRALSHSTDLHVVSHLTTAAFKGGCASPEDIGRRLNANYVLSGTFSVIGCPLIVNCELTETKSGEILWTQQHKVQGSSVYKGRFEFIASIVSGVSSMIMARELRRARVQALPNLESYTLLLAAVALMHRLSSQDFSEARQLLQALVDRAPRAAIPLAWLAKWHVFRVQQGWSEDARKDAAEALQCTRRALDTDPNCSLALSIDGFVQTNLYKHIDMGLAQYERAIGVNPSESLAWLLKGTLHAFRGEGDVAVRCSQRALKLSPLDPHRFFYDSLAATTHLAARQFDRALQAAKRSLRANRTHTSTLRALAVAQWELGQCCEAKLTCEELLRLEPTFTVSGWLERSPSSAYPIGREWANVFRAMGIPD